MIRSGVSGKSLRPIGGGERGTVIAIALAAVVLLGGGARAAAQGFDPHAILLTWQQDPTTTMTIDWHQEPDDDVHRALKVRVTGSGDEFARVEPVAHPFPFTDRTIYRVELTELEPGETYTFYIGEEGERFRFRTMPADATRAIHFAAGGDTRHRQDWMEQTNREAARYDLDFIMWGGDLAYADGREDRINRWDEWFEAIRDGLVRDDGRVIPVVMSIGNHEVRGGYFRSHDDYEPTDTWRERIAPFYFGLFAFPGHPGYAALDFGDYLSIILLDTDHANPIDGEQTAWLEQALAERDHVPHVFPLYHVPAYPSHRNPAGRVETRVRDHFVPLFEEHGVRYVFENHDHTYKRTHPIRDGERASDGIVYLGDGAWGVNTREVHLDRWYIADAQSKRHFILGTIQGPAVRFQVISENGELMDEFPEAPRRDD